jgi:Calcineurin-like phosphoesterase
MTKSFVSGYDVIGDIHDHAAALEELLSRMNYVKRDGAWAHPDHIAVYVGDFVDRGPENLRACRIVIDMCAAGAARAIMGNHDFNAVCLATPDPKRPGEYLRPHTPKNLHQTAATRDELQRNPQGGQAVLAWLRRLPLWLDLEDLRVVHASWSSRAINMLKPYLDSHGAFTDEGLARASEKGDSVRSAREILLNGVEAAPPGARELPDAEGHMRSEIRLKWWRAGENDLTWREAALVPESVREYVPDTPLSPEVLQWIDTEDPRPVISDTIG